MSGVKGMQHYGAQIIDSVLQLREEGKPYREIVAIFKAENYLEHINEDKQRYKKK